MLHTLNAAVRSELTAAADACRFDDLAELATLAKEITALTSRWPCHLELGAIKSKSGSPQATCTAAEALKPPSSSVSQSKLMTNTFPHFLREKDDLVKLGWSRKEKGPYEHRTPKSSVDSVVSAVLLNGKTGHRFTIDEIKSALPHPETSGKIPIYQIYAVVSWLKWAGLVLQHGRQGYTAVRPQTFISSFEIAWQSLSER